MSSAFLDIFVPEAGHAEPQLRRRQRLLVGISMVMGTLGIVLGVADFVKEGYAAPTVWVFLVGSGLVWANPFVLRATGSLTVTGTLLLSEMLLGAGALSALSRGMQALPLVWSMFVPLLGYALFGARTATACVAAVVVQALAWYALSVLGEPSPDAISGADTRWWTIAGMVGMGAVVTAFVWFSDAERRAADALVRASEDRLRLSQRFVSLGSLASGIGHEINNPLAYVSANLDYLHDELRAALSPESANADDLTSAVADARDGTARIRESVARLQTFADQKARDVHPVDVSVVLELAVALAGCTVRHRARISRDVRRGLCVLGDEAPLTQAVLNVIVNAAHALPDGHADEHQLHVRCFPRDDEVVIEVGDPSAPDVADPDAFDPFFRASHTDGAALGLSVSHAAIASLGGHIEFDRGDGAGTRVRLVLPAAAPVRTALRPVAGASAAGWASVRRYLRGRR